MAKNKFRFYAVAVGRQPGIYNTWTEAEQMVTGFVNARYKGFVSRDEAVSFISAHSGGAAGATAIRAVPSAVSNHATPTLVSMAHGYHASESDSDVLEVVQQPKRPQPPAPSTPARVAAPAKSLDAAPHLRFADVEYADVRWYPFVPKLTVFCDGGSSANGTANAAAGYGAFYGKDDPRNLSARVPREYEQTNNVAELMACKVVIERQLHEDNTRWTAYQAECHRLMAMDAVPDLPDPPATVVIRTDSMYSIKCVTEWVYKWMNNGFKTTGNAEIKNRGLIMDVFNAKKRREALRLAYIEALDAAVAHGPYRLSAHNREVISRFAPIRSSKEERAAFCNEATVFRHIKGHAGHFGNEMADSLATQGAALPFGHQRP